MIENHLIRLNQLRAGLSNDSVKLGDVIYEANKILERVHYSTVQIRTLKDGMNLAAKIHLQQQEVQTRLIAAAELSHKNLQEFYNGLVSLIPTPVPTPVPPPIDSVPKLKKKG